MQDVASSAPGAAEAGRWQVATATRASRLFAVAALALVALAVVAPAFLGRGALGDLFFIFTMLTLAQNWNLLAGYAGLVSVGQQAFVGIGGYALFGGVILAGLDPLTAVLLGALAGGLLAIPTAFFVFRLQGAYFAIGTWVIAEVIRLLVSQWKALGGGTGTSLPRSAIFDMPFVDTIETLFGVRAPQARDMIGYWMALALALVTIGFVYGLMRSRLGLALAAVRDNETAARAFGVAPLRIKALVYFAAAVLTGLAGAIIYLQTARISPDSAFSVLEYTAYVIFIVVIGGIGTIEGPIIGVVVFFLLQSTLADYGSWYLMFLGLIAIAVMLFAPRGLWGLISDRFDLHLFPVRRRLIAKNDKGGNP